MDAATTSYQFLENPTAGRIASNESLRPPPTYLFPHSSASRSLAQYLKRCSLRDVSKRKAKSLLESSGDPRRLIDGMCSFVFLCLFSSRRWTDSVPLSTAIAFALSFALVLLLISMISCCWILFLRRSRTSRLWIIQASSL